MFVVLAVSVAVPGLGFLGLLHGLLFSHKVQRLHEWEENRSHNNETAGKVGRWSTGVLTQQTGTGEITVIW